ncbi:MAG: hypothetical protein JXX28_18755 [Deltaproteobacteria bacterium]|nr:hypothetical protein [Deltaproteobacteria bacterium]
MTVLLSEIRRVARRPTLTVLRTALVLVVLVIFAVVLGQSGGMSSYRANLGPALFNGSVGVLQLTALILGPALVARGLEEEREEQTLDLLVLTGLRPVWVVLGKVGVRLGQMGLLLLGALPFMALAVSLGGVDPIRTAIATLTLGYTLVFLGLVGAWLGLRAGGGLAASLGGLVVAGLTLAVPSLSAWFTETTAIGPGRHADDVAVPALLLAGPYLDRPFEALISVIGTLPLALLLGLDLQRHLGGARRRLALGCLGWLAALGFGLLPLVYPFISYLQPGFPKEVWQGLWLAMTLPAVSAWSWFALQAMRLLAALEGGGGLWSRIRALGAPSGSVELQVRRQRRVWGRPVLWRELMTGSQGLLVRLGPLVAVLVTTSAMSLSGLALLIWSSDLTGAVITLQNLAAFGGIFHGVMGTVLVSLRAIAGERRDHTLDLLLLTDLSAEELVLSKVGASALFGLLPLLLGVLLGQWALGSIAVAIAVEAHDVIPLSASAVAWVGVSTVSGLVLAVAAWALLSTLVLTLGHLLEHGMAWIAGFAIGLMLFFPGLALLYEISGVFTLLGAVALVDSSLFEDGLLAMSLSVPVVHLVLALAAGGASALLGTMLRDALRRPERILAP